MLARGWGSEGRAEQGAEAQAAACVWVKSRRSERLWEGSRWGRLPEERGLPQAGHNGGACFKQALVPRRWLPGWWTLSGRRVNSVRNEA